jgi:flagellar basal-body rod protein FlgB
VLLNDFATIYRAERALQADKLFGMHFIAAQLREHRAGVLAGNIANADTPHYKARDVDFSTALGRATGGDLNLRTTHATHVARNTLPGDAEVKYRNPLQAALDGNTVDVHVEHAAFAENALQYQTSLQFLDARIKGVIKALTGE